MAKIEAKDIPEAVKALREAEKEQKTAWAKAFAHQNDEDARDEYVNKALHFKAVATDNALPIIEAQQAVMRQTTDALANSAQILSMYRDAIDDYENADKAWWDEVYSRVNAARSAVLGSLTLPDHLKKQADAD